MNLAVNLHGQANGVLNHVGVLLHILLHHAHLLDCLLNGFLIIRHDVPKLFHVGDAIQRLRELLRAVGAPDCFGAGLIR